jgi:molybdenum cofactor cytidylyltransferase
VSDLIFSAVVLAAGKSERMGINKLLIKIDEQTLLEKLLETIKAANIHEIIVVLGHKPTELKSIVETHGAIVVVNPNYEEGMTSSVKTGFQKVTTNASFLCLGDQVMLNKEIFTKMMHVMKTNIDAMIVSPVYQERRGHPVLFREKTFSKILSLNPKQTLKEVVSMYEENHLEVEGNIFCTFDIDIPGDLKKLKNLLQDA